MFLTAAFKPDKMVNLAETVAKVTFELLPSNIYYQYIMHVPSIENNEGAYSRRRMWYESTDLMQGQQQSRLVPGSIRSTTVMLLVATGLTPLDIRRID